MFKSFVEDIFNKFLTSTSTHEVDTKYIFTECPEKTVPAELAQKVLLFSTVSIESESHFNPISAGRGGGSI